MILVLNPVADTMKPRCVLDRGRPDTSVAEPKTPVETLESSRGTAGDRSWGNRHHRPHQGCGSPGPDEGQRWSLSALIFAVDDGIEKKGTKSAKRSAWK